MVVSATQCSFTAMWSYKLRRRKQMNVPDEQFCFWASTVGALLQCYIFMLYIWETFVVKGFRNVWCLKYNFRCSFRKKYRLCKSTSKHNDHVVRQRKINGYSSVLCSGEVQGGWAAVVSCSQQLLNCSHGSPSVQGTVCADGLGLAWAFPLCFPNVCGACAKMCR